MENNIKPKVVPQKKAQQEVRLWLRQGLGMKPRINALRIQLDYVTHQMFSPASPADPARPKVQTSPSGDPPFVAASEEKEALEEKLNHMIRLYTALEAQIINTINQYCTDGREALTLTLYYLHGKKWSEISQALNLSIKHSHRVMDYAITKIVLPEDAIWVSKQAL